MKKFLWVIPLLVAIMVPFLLESCNKDESEPARDIELVFTRYSSDDLLNIEVLQHLIDDPSVRNIYLIPDGRWDGCNARNIKQMRQRFFQPRIEMSSKIQGRGNFTFEVGEASKVPEDSLWYVQQGWTINKQLNDE